jgi:hypothetical protein
VHPLSLGQGLGEVRRAQAAAEREALAHGQGEWAVFVQ